MMTNLILRLKALLKRRELDAELDEELAHHLEMKQLALRQEGSADPKGEAQQALGGELRWKEQTRSQWSFTSMEAFNSDLKYAARLLAKDRAFTLVALATLALGIGSNTAIFSLLNGLLWRPLPVEHPEQLVRLTVQNLPPSYRQWVNGKEVKAREQRTITFATYQALERSGVFAGVFGIVGGGNMNFEHKGVPNRKDVTTVTGSYFPVLGLRAQAGRLLNESDDVPGGPSTGWHVVISDAVWTRMFSRSADAIGASVAIERIPFTIIGVAPASFVGTNPGVELDAWIPVHAMESMFPSWKWRTNRTNTVLQPLARLRPGMTVEQARQQLQALSPTIFREAMDPGLRAEDRKHFIAMQLVAYEAPAGQSWLAVNFGETLVILLAAVGAVLLIASTNLTNLMLARSTARAREIAVRLALGAPRWRIRRQFLLESALLAIGGTAAGLLWARWLIDALQSAVSTGQSAIRVDTSLDLRMFAFLAGVLVAVVLLAGLAPAITAGRTAPNQVIKAHSGGSRAYRLRGSLIVLQTALSLTLLAGAGLMASSLYSLLSESTGLDADNCVFLLPDFYTAGVSRERMPLTYERVLSEAKSQPNVLAAAWIRSIPLNGSLVMFTVEIPGRTDLDVKQRSVFWHEVGDGYFAATGIPILAGSALPASGRTDVGVISEAAARRFFGGVQQAVGQRLKPGKLDPVEIIGVAGDTKHTNIRETPPPSLYMHYGPDPGLAMTLAVRYRGSQDATVRAMQTLFQKEAGRLPYTQVRTLDGVVAQSIRSERLLALLLGGFAVFALLISATGLWGLLSYAVEQRRKELGIRIALGAGPGRIRSQITRQALWLTGFGALAGAFLSYGLRRSLDAYLYGITAADPWIWGCGIGVMLAAAVGAAAIPAWRASRVDPLEMLRQD